MQARRRPASGFTLVEVLVALFVMAVLSGLAWQGVDSMLRTREATRAAIERTSRLDTVLAQWEQDLSSLQETSAAPALQFDGSSLRLTRLADGGVQTVVWAVRDGAWWRWSAPPTAQFETLQQQWLASQQLQGNEPGQLRLIDGAGDWQIYYYRGNAWTNAQSTGELSSRAGGPPGAPPAEALPAAVRLVIELPGGALTRDLPVPPQPD
jgi:general secretion pathway protein J